MSDENKCVCCGAAFTPTCHSAHQKYCSSKCRMKYNNRKRYTPPENACVNCGASLEHIEQVGRNRRFCGDACRDAYNHQKEKERKQAARNEPRVCPNCGKDFVPLWKTGSPRFCCDECRIEWWKEYHKHNPDEQKTSTTCAYCGCEMRGDGKYCSRACYRLGAARVRGEKTCLWCGKLLPKKARSTQKYCCTKCAKASWRLTHSDEYGQRCIRTKNPTAWRRQLMELTNKTVIDTPKDYRILLVCGTMNLVSTDILVNFIRFELCCDPFDGNAYVFCNGGHSHLKWLRWDGCGFCVGSRQAEWGSYPWPPEKEGFTVEITELEFTFLCSKSAEKINTESP